MPKWKDIAKLSDREEQTREAAFEAEMLAALAADKPKPSAASSPPRTILRPTNHRVSRCHPDLRHGEWSDHAV